MKNRIIIVFIFCTFISLILPNYCFSQTKNSNLEKNSIQISIGSYFLLYENININYERILIQNIGKDKASFFTRIGGGLEAVLFENNGMYINNQYGFFFGKGNHFFEWSIGPCYLYTFDNPDLDSDWPGIKLSKGYIFFPFPSVGWRFQKPDDHFIIRVGASLPESIYFGVGYTF